MSNFMQRITDLISEPKRMLAPVKGFESYPTVSIEKAVEPLEVEIPDIRHMVWTVKRECELRPKNFLTIDESASIMLYSLQWTSPETSFYYILNQTLRAIDRNKLKPWFLYLKLFFVALTKLPSVADTVYRGVRADIHKDYPTGSRCIWWGFSSCTDKIDLLQSEQFLGQSGTRTIFNIKCRSGKDIREYSFYPDEAEILLLAAREFRVKGCLNAGNDLHIIEIEEYESEFPLIAPLTDIIVTKTSPKSTNKSSSTSNILAIPGDARWSKDAVRIIENLDGPKDVTINPNDGTVFVTDEWNHRIVAWTPKEQQSRTFAGGNGAGNGLNQLNRPNGIIFDMKTNSIFVRDYGNRRIVRFTLDKDVTCSEVIVNTPFGYGLVIDDEGTLFINDTKNDAILQYKNGDKNGTVVAGGNLKGSQLDQINVSNYLTLDSQGSLYISDTNNHRVLKWMKGAKEGIVIAGGKGFGSKNTHLSNPQGIVVDKNDNCYVSDFSNNRILRIRKEDKEPEPVVQVPYPLGLTFDHQNNMYVTSGSNSVYRFMIIK